jgi:hypothetical protein
LAQLIGNYGKNQQDPNDHLLQIGLDMSQVHSVLDEANKYCTKDDATESPGATPKADTTYNARSNRVERQGCPNISFPSLEAGGQHDASDRRE